MTLSEYILENTDDGLDMARLLIDVMNGFIRGVTPSHRLTAARLLTIYGFQDARDFIDDNTLPPSDEGRHWVVSDPELARLIRARTNDGQEMCDFLIDVMWGKVERTRVGHRVSAARELLNRAFGRNQGIPLPNPPRKTAPRGTIQRTDLQAEPAPVEEQPPLPQGEGWGEGENPVRPEPVEGQSVPPAQTQVPTETDHEVAPASVRPQTESGADSEPVEGQSVLPAQTAVVTEPEHQPEPSRWRLRPRGVQSGKQVHRPQLRSDARSLGRRLLVQLRRLRQHQLSIPRRSRRPRLRSQRSPLLTHAGLPTNRRGVGQSPTKLTGLRFEHTRK